MLARSRTFKLKSFDQRWHRSARIYTKHTDLHHGVRELLRETAQPVAVITSYMPCSSSSSGDVHPFHGATLSSFASISMSPHPLVAFSLRVPSRMATSLSLLAKGDLGAFSHKDRTERISTETHLVANILSASQQRTAVMFSRPDLHPRPFDETNWSSTQEGLPIIHNSLGALSCKIIAGPWPLHDLEALGGLGGEAGPSVETTGKGDVSSELFIARVMRVEDIPLDVDHELRPSPLLYHRRRYATTQDFDLS